MIALEYKKNIYKSKKMIFKYWPRFMDSPKIEAKKPSKNGLFKRKNLAFDARYRISATLVEFGILGKMDT
jgi:hypothetical protein